jgi:hypothetical protein
MEVEDSDFGLMVSESWREGLARFLSFHWLIDGSVRSLVRN